jgi:hypothetical protein
MELFPVTSQGLSGRHGLPLHGLDQAGGMMNASGADEGLPENDRPSVFNRSDISVELHGPQPPSIQSRPPGRVTDRPFDRVLLIDGVLLRRALVDR